MKNKLIILSLAPLFFLTFIQNLPWDKLNNTISYMKNKELLLNHKCLLIGLFMCVVWMVISILIYVNFKYFFKYGTDSGFEITNLKEEKEAGLNFFLALILPIIVNDLSNLKGFLSFWATLVIIILLLSKTNLYYQNPMLIILGYRVYKFKFVDNNQLTKGEYVGISFNEVNIENTIEYKEIEDNVLIIRQMR